jgi:hypothetical protein
MFFGQDLMQITLRLTLIPLKITKVIKFHSQYNFLHFLKIEKIYFR